MPDPENSLASSAAILESLGYAVFHRSPAGALCLSSSPPDWLRRLWPSLGSPQAALPVSDGSPFLRNFLVDAEACWRLGGDNQARSGPWLAVDEPGTGMHLEATALSAAGESILLIQRLGADIVERHRLVSMARENALAQQRLELETQTKELLLHCLAEDINEGLGNVTMAVRLLEIEDRPTQVRQLLALAGLATQEQQSVIHRLLRHFTGELDGLRGRGGGEGTDLGAILRRAWSRVESEFAGHGVRLKAPQIEGEGPRVAAPAGSLERVLVNLLENALQHTPRGEEIRLVLETLPDGIRVRVEDPGECRPSDLQEKLFCCADPEALPLGASAVRLQFCRIVIENCQGEIGCDSQPGGGNVYWFRLPLAGLTE